MILDFDSFIFLVSFLIDILRGFSRFLKLRIILAVRVFIGVIYIIWKDRIKFFNKLYICMDGKLF